MDKDSVIVFFWLTILLTIWIKYRAIKKGSMNKSGYKTLEITRAFNPAELHGHRCYIDDLTDYEYRIVKHLSRHLSPKDYYIFSNITVPSSVTVTSQTDHIIVSKYGIFVIENKDYTGWIFGHKNQKKWTQVVKGGKKFHFQNPLLQNFAHVSALKEQMPFLRRSFYSVIVFSEDSEFKTKMPSHVMHGENLVDYIESKKSELVSEGELLMAVGKLSMLCQTNQVTNEKHVENLEVVHSEGGLTPIPLSSHTRTSS